MQRVLIIGATSAIAAAVAKEYGSRGARLHLVGRNPEKLREVANRCPGEVTMTVADFNDFDNNSRIIAQAVEALGELDVVLIAHGLLGDQLESEQSFAEAAAIISTNFTSVVSLLIPLANIMEARGNGTLGVITSVAGDRGRPRNYTYGAAKGALNVYLQGLRSRLYPAGVHVTTLKLGPVDTPMTTTHEKNALFSTPERVARDIVRALSRGASEVYVPAFWAAIMKVVEACPEVAFQRLRALSGR